MRAPFPWFGGKSRVAGVVWRAFGNVPNYVEPFAGSLAVLLGRPHEPKTETVNDADAHLANFWRAVRADHEAVAHWCDWPVNEADLEARHIWLVRGLAEHRERVKGDADFYDAKIAGWWVWGLCQWIGSGWCAQRGKGRASATAADLGNAGMGVHRQLPHLGDAGMGVRRQLPHLGDAGRGVHRQLPHLGGGGGGGGGGITTAEFRDALPETFAALAARLRRVRVACGDWSRVMGDSVTWRHGTTAIFLDPPYDDGEIVYAAGGTGVAADVAAWCRENGDDERLRIALCGYEGDHALPGWTEHAWKAHGGFGSQGNGAGRKNAERETIWFSPGCLPLEAAQTELFGKAERC